MVLSEVWVLSVTVSSSTLKYIIRSNICMSEMAIINLHHSLACIEIIHFNEGSIECFSPFSWWRFLVLEHILSTTFRQILICMAYVASWTHAYCDGNPLCTNGDHLVVLNEFVMLPTLHSQHPCNPNSHQNLRVTCMSCSLLIGIFCLECRAHDIQYVHLVEALDLLPNMV